MRWSIPLVVVLAAFVAVSCDQQPVEPQLQQETVAPLFSSGHGAVAEKVSGGWNDRNPGFPRTFAFTAIQYADGSVNGRWERFGVAHGDVLCFTVVGNQAWIGTVRDDTPPGIPWAGTEGGFRVVDNGEGANALPDQMSLQWYNQGPGFAANYCATTPTSPDFIAGVGNIQVK